MINHDDQDSHFPIEFYKASSIRHICYGNPEFSMFYFTFLSPEISLEIIKSLFVSEPPKIFRTTKTIPTTLHYRWLIACLISKFESQIKGNFQRFILPKYYFNPSQKIQLSLLNSLALISINKLATNPQIRIQEKLQMKLAKNLLKLYDENRPLFEWISEDRAIAKYFKNLSLEDFFVKFNFKCLKLFQCFQSKQIFGETQDFQTILFNITEVEDQQELYMIPAAIIDQNPLFYYQICYMKSHPYPNNDNDPIFSLINESLFNSTFFVDFYRNFLKTQIESTESKAADPIESKKPEEKRYLQLNEFISQTDFLGDMQSWCYLSLFPNNIVQNYENFSHEVDAVQFQCDNIVTQLFERLKNDRILLKNIQNWTGYLVIANDFTTKSLPKQIGLYLNNITPDTIYNLITSKRLLCLTDEERQMDSDFLNGFVILTNLMKMAQSEPNFESIEKITNLIELALRNLNPDSQIALLRDSFSLLFVTTKDGQFFVPPIMVTTVLQILLNFYDEELIPFLQKALSQIQAAQQLNPNLTSLIDVLISPKQKLFESLEKGNFSVSEYLSKFNPETEKIFKRYNIVHKLRNKVPVDISKLTIEEIEECGLAIEGQFQLFDRISTESTIEEVKTLTKMFDYHKPFEISKTIPNEKLQNLISKLTNSQNTEWSIPSFTFSEFKLTKGFFDYFDLLVPPLLESNKTINDVLNESADEIIDKFLEKEEFDKAEKVAELVQLDIRKKVLSETKYTENCYRRYSDSIPIVLDTISLFTSFAFNQSLPIITKIRNTNHVTQNFILKAHKSIDPSPIDLNQKVEYEDLSDQKGITVTKSFLTDVFDQNDHELLIDLSYRCDTELIEEFIKEKVNNDNIESISELVKSLPISLSLMKQVRFLLELNQNGFVVSFDNIEEIFSKTLNENRYSLSRLCYVNFPNKSKKFDELLIEFLRYLKNVHVTADPEILIVAPHLNHQIKTIIVKIEHDKEINDFKEKIPSNWVFMNGIQKTLIGNFNNNPSIVVNFLREYPNIDLDSTIIEHIRLEVNEFDSSSITKLNFFMTQVNRVIGVIRSISLFFDFFFETLISLFSEIRIKSKIEENSLNHEFRSIDRLLNQFSIRQRTRLNQIISLDKFCSEYFYTRFHFSYHLNEIDELINFSLDKGFYSIASALATAFSIDVTEAFFNIYLNQFRLSVFGLDKRAIQFSFKENHQLQTKCSQQFQYYAEKLPEFNTELISNLSANITIIHNESDQKTAEIDLIINKILEAPIKYIANDITNHNLDSRNEEIFHFLKEESDLSIATSFYVFDMDKAFSILDSRCNSMGESNLLLTSSLSNKSDICISDDNLSSDNSDIFVIDNSSHNTFTKIDLSQLDSNETAGKSLEKAFLRLFESSISYSQINSFSKTMQQHQHYSIFLHHIYTKLLINQNNNFSSYLLMNISRIIGEHYATAKSALSLYTVNPQLSLLDIAEGAINDMNNNSKSIQKTLKTIDFQRRFIIFCTERNLNVYESLNLFLGEKAVQSIIILLFKHYEFELSIDILKSIMNNNSPKTWYNQNISKPFVDIIAQTAFSMANDGYKAISGFIQALQMNVHDEELFELIVFLFLQQIESNTIHEIDWIRQIALNVVTKGHYQVKLLLGILDVENAANVAITKNVKELLPLVANRAFSLDKFETYLKCQKAL